jgi:hypothetical protein
MYLPPVVDRDEQRPQCPFPARLEPRSQPILRRKGGVPPGAFVLIQLPTGQDIDVGKRDFTLVADASSDDPAAIEPILRQLTSGEIVATKDGFHVEATMEGESARELNRSLLSALRRAERRTRLRSAWTGEGVTERFFDYVSKGSRAAPLV